MNRIKIEINTVNNLLGFSAGVDSTALFHLMLEEGIDFDIAIVDYGQRVQSKDEVIYATQLAHKYGKKCFISNYPNTLKFNEKDARDYRHNFFEEIINKNNYDSLITAHQLNDKLEWFLMQFTKGAGLPELIGMSKVRKKKNYLLLKPLLDVSKKELQNYLDINNIKYFLDESNDDEKYKRNYFRHNFSNALLEEYESGVFKSFNYLEKDNQSFFDNTEYKKIEELTIFSFNGDSNIGLRLIDQNLKERGIIISHMTRDEIEKSREIVVSHTIAISILKNKIFIAPVVNVSMSKSFKEKCRTQKIPKNVRPYIFKLFEKGLFTF